VSGRERGALAIVLHTHMPYVEGFGTWPFGEEWLWEAVACSYLPLLQLLERDAPLSLSLTPVLCDQLEAPGVSERFERFIEDVRRSTHAEDAAGLQAAGHAELAAAVERSWQDYERALGSLRSRGGDLLGAFAHHVQWTSSATHAVLPMLASDAAVQLQVRAGVESHRRRFGEGWRGGFWLPECGFAPWLEPTLAAAGVAASCIELTDSLGLGAPAHLRPISGEAGLVLVPIDRETMSLVWSERGYPAAGAYRDYHHHTVHHHNPWSNDGSAYDHAAAHALAAEHAADFVARTRERLRRAQASERAGSLPGGGLVVCALDTELLGHWWYEGVAWLAAVVEECSRQGLELVRLDDALEREAATGGASAADRPRSSRAPGACRPSSWGLGGDLSTWSGPAVAELAFGARAAELEVLHRSVDVDDVAIRELLALQASDWAFMCSRGIAAPYARERFERHRDGLRRALDGDAWPERVRNLAVHAHRALMMSP
jgi:1,4-alpha-glucan branching enzyme